MKHITQKDINELYSAIMKLETLEECQKFFRDLLTETEIQEMTERWKVAKLLSQGMSYTKIEEQTGVSSRTIARVGRWLKQGKGGYTLLLQKTKSQSQD